MILSRSLLRRVLIPAVFIGLCAGLTTGSGPAQAQSDDEQMRQELKATFLPVYNHIHHHYIDALPPDSLARAGIRGLFQALDPASEFTLEASDIQDWSGSWATFEKVAHLVNRHAFYAVSADSLVRFSIHGVMSVLDPDTVFMEKLSLDNFHINVRGEYGGLGFRIQVVRPDSAIAVWSLLHDDTPAARAGVKSGDLIIAIDDSSTKELSAGDAAGLMRGPAGTPVTLTLQRAGVDEPLKITVVRQQVHIASVPYYTLFPDSTGYIKLDQFQQNCSQEVRDALVKLQKEGMKRLIFDLRGNGGGYLQEAVRVADLFLPPERLVVFTAGRAFKDTTSYFTEEEALYGEGPLVVMVDGGSASASEIVAGAIQDWDRGLILGTPTVGKGSVQQTISIGDRAELKLTMAAYFIPSGRSIDKRMRKDSTLVAMAEQDFYTRVLNRRVRGAGGITPDIEAEGRKANNLYSQLDGWRTWDNKFFRFARQYPVDHADLSPSFVADGKVIADFRKFLEESDFDYLSEMEMRLNQLADEVATEEVGNRLDDELAQLEVEIDDIEEKHWQAHADLLVWKLTFDILEKRFGITAAEAYDTTVNPQILRAREIVTNQEEYASWFQKPAIGASDEAAVAATAAASATEGEDLSLGAEVHTGR